MLLRLAEAPEVEEKKAEAHVTLDPEPEVLELLRDRQAGQQIVDRLPVLALEPGPEIGRLVAGANLESTVRNLVGQPARLHDVVVAL